MSFSMPTVEECFLPLLRVLAESGTPLVEQIALQTAKQQGFGSRASIVHIQTDKRGVPLIQQRLAWAKFYLIAAGFIQHRSRNLIQITDAGLEVAAANSCTWATLSNSRPWTQKFGLGWLPPQAG